MGVRAEVMAQMKKEEQIRRERYLAFVLQRLADMGGTSTCHGMRWDSSVEPLNEKPFEHWPNRKDMLELMARGHVTCRWMKRYNVYTITDSGKQWTKENPP